VGRFSLTAKAGQADLRSYTKQDNYRRTLIMKITKSVVAFQVLALALGLFASLMKSVPAGMAVAGGVSIVLLSLEYLAQRREQKMRLWLEQARQDRAAFNDGVIPTIAVATASV
jgi:hypothetical protein